MGGRGRWIYRRQHPHSAENHRGTFRGAPMREETREKERDEGKKARELVASMKLKQKTWGNISCRSERTVTHAVTALILSPSHLHSHLFSLLSFSYCPATDLTETVRTATSLHPTSSTQTCSFSRWTELFFFFLSFFLSFITRRRTRSTVEITRRRDVDSS